MVKKYRGWESYNMEMLSRFFQRERFTSTVITYPHQRIYQFHNNQTIVSSTESLYKMGCATGVWSFTGTQQQRYPRALQETSMLSIIVYIFSNDFDNTNVESRT